MAEVRLLTKDDAQIFQPLRLRSFKEETEAFFFTFAEMKDRPIAYWEVLLSKGFTAGAFVDNCLVGFAGLRVEQGEKICHRAYLGAVYVVPEMRGQGIAQAIIKFLLEEAKELKVELVRLSTNQRNEKTVGLYKKFGFEPYGIEKNYLKLEDGSYIDEVLMVKFLA